MNIADIFPARYCGGRHLPAGGEIVTSICARAPKPTQPSEAQPQPETTGAPA